MKKQRTGAGMPEQGVGSMTGFGRLQNCACAPRYIRCRCTWCIVGLRTLEAGKLYMFVLRHCGCLQVLWYPCC